MKETSHTSHTLITQLIWREVQKIFSFFCLDLEKHIFLSGKVFLSLAKFLTSWAWRKLCQYSEKNQKQCQSSWLGLIVIYKSLILDPYGRNQKIILFGFRRKWVQENLLLKFFYNKFFVYLPFHFLYFSVFFYKERCF